MTSTLNEARGVAARSDREYREDIVFARSAPITIARHHINSLRKVVKVFPREKCFLNRIYAPDDVKVSTVRWLLVEGSNLKELYKHVGGNLFARYILDRRALAIIAEQYPALKSEVKHLVHTDYTPMKWPPICLLEGYKSLEAGGADISKSEREEQALRHILETQTDYAMFMRLRAKPLNKMTEEQVEERRKHIASLCYLAVAAVFPEFSALAREKAENLQPLDS